MFSREMRPFWGAICLALLVGGVAVYCGTAHQVMEVQIMTQDEVSHLDGLTILTLALLVGSVFLLPKRR